MYTKQIYVFQDSVSGSLSDLLTLNSEKEAIRIFASSIDAAGLPRNYRDDLILKHLGEITVDDNGEVYVRGFEVGRHVMRGSAPEVDSVISWAHFEPTKDSEEEVSGDVEVSEE